MSAIDAPTLLVFDDLQWADEISLEIIGELARLGRDVPLLLVGAYRVDELPVDSYHREWRARLLNQRLAEEARLAPLTYEQTALVTTLILGTGLPAPSEVVKAVFARTDGIPLHIEELLGALGEAARQDGRAIREAVVPDTIEDAILARSALLSPEAREVARAGAVIGRCFVPEVLAGVLDRPVDELDAAPRGARRTARSCTRSSSSTVATTTSGTSSCGMRCTAASRPPTCGASTPGPASSAQQLIGASAVHASLHFERAGLRPQAFRAALAGARAASAMSSRRESFELYARAAANIPEDLPALERAELFDGYFEAAAAVDDVPVAVVETARPGAPLVPRGRLPAAAIGCGAAQRGRGRAPRRLDPPYERLRLLDDAEDRSSSSLPDIDRARGRCIVRPPPVPGRWSASTGSSSTRPRRCSMRHDRCGSQSGNTDTRRHDFIATPASTC